MGILDPFSAWLHGWFPPLHVVKPRVFVINFDPIIEENPKRLLSEVRHYNDVDTLIGAFIKEIDEVSHHLVQYQYDSQRNYSRVEEFTHLLPDFHYTVDEYLAVLDGRAKHHEPDAVNYAEIIDTYDLIGRVMRNEIDEVWLFGGPWFGFSESHMVGKGAIWCNSDAEPNTDQCTRRFVIMGFNYERLAVEMVHDIGHRMEAIMAAVYGSLDAWNDAYAAARNGLASLANPKRFQSPKNDYERFMLYEGIAPGRAEVGLIHMPPNAQKDLDWWNAHPASSACDDWLSSPRVQKPRRMVDCGQWNAPPDEDGYLRWWFEHVPHYPGSKNGILNNWWDYTMRVDQPFHRWTG